MTVWVIVWWQRDDVVVEVYGDGAAAQERSIVLGDCGRHRMLICARVR